MITVTMRSAGARRPLVPDWQIPMPPGIQSGGEPVTLRRVIEAVVRTEVDAFNKRQRDARFVRVLTDREIETAAAHGKVDMLGRDHVSHADPDAAVGTALRAFEDGIYLLFLDGAEQRDLDREVFLKEDSTVMFVRLTMLAGG